MQNLTNTNFTQSISQWLVVVDFYATWCWPCNMVAPYLEELSTHLEGKATFYKVNVDEERALTMEQWITWMPTFKIFKDWVEIKKIVGADMQTLVDTLQHNL